MDSYEISVVSKNSNAISSYVLKCVNIIGDVDVDGMKVVVISKAQMWWNNLNDSEKFILIFMLTMHRGLSPLENEKLIKYKDFYQQFNLHFMIMSQMKHPCMNQKKPSKNEMA